MMTMIVVMMMMMVIIQMMMTIMIEMEMMVMVRMRQMRQDLRERMNKIRTNSKVEKKWTKMHRTNFCLKISTPPFFQWIF